MRPLIGVTTSELRPSRLATTRAGLACGDWAVNTLQPAWEPQGSFGAPEPPTDDRTVALNIGDRMSDAGVSWAWYAGGWDNAAGNVGGAQCSMDPPLPSVGLRGA